MAMPSAGKMSLANGPDALAALMAYVAGVRDKRLDALREAAAAECAELLAAARAKARAQVRQALREARADAEAQVAVARAAMQARVRRRRQALTLAALAGVQARVAAKLGARWGDADARAAWIAMALAEAARSLPPGTWGVALPAGAGPLPAAPDGVTLTVAADASIAAGLRVRCGDAEIDATLDGLLRDPERIAALWLGAIERRRGAS